MVRMQSDARLPAAERLGYKHIGDALVRIAKEEGVRTYWRGATPTGTRGCIARTGHFLHKLYAAQTGCPGCLVFVVSRRQKAI